jgi:hypothetical protein
MENAMTFEKSSGLYFESFGNENAKLIRSQAHGGKAHLVGKHEYQQMQASGRDLLAVLPNNSRGVLVTVGPKSTLREEHNWAMTAPVFYNATVRACIEDRALPAELLPL